jgi:uncharacterized protein YbgA (DUF1722 family)/uncharacterized protein YbbK (DUF523 family)
MAAARGDVSDKIRIGVSSCLLGNEVRFDGGHKRNEFVADTFGQFVEFVAVCPEVEIGMGTPRESIALHREQGELHLLGNQSGADFTAKMKSYADRRTRALGADDLSGYILKKDSPSCGMARVRVYAENGMPSREGIGMFAAALMRRYPNLPVEEEGRLTDPKLRENFVERVFAYRRLQDFFAARWTQGGLIAFHTAHKLVLLAHSPNAYRELGRYVAEAKKIPRAEFRHEYETRFMSALKKLATPPRHVNVMQHMLGYFRDHLDEAARRELAGVIEDYARGLVPLIVPLTLIRHYVGRFEVEYLAGQVYLNPHPKELMLLNHV